jgi:hypothetical protein
VSAPLRNLVVHVGLAQSGSTTLQKHIFNRTDFGFALLTPYEQRRETVRRHIELPLPGEFDAAASRAFFESRFAAFADPALVPVISNEGLTGQNFLRMDRNPETELFARRLGEAFGAIRILVILREQNALVLSKYRKLLERFEGNVTLRQFVRRKPHGQRVQTDADSVFLGLFEFDKLVGMYRSFFGAQNVLALPLEMMERDAPQFIARLNAFCGTRIPAGFAIPRTNVNGAAGSSRFYRWYNTVYSRVSRGRAAMRRTPVGRASRWLQSSLVRMAGALGSREQAIAAERQRQRHELAGIVGDYFAASNERLSTMLGLDLAGFGYVTKRAGAAAPKATADEVRPA